MTLKFEIPFPVNLTDEQITLMKNDINTRLQSMNQKLETQYELEYYRVSLIVGVREASE